MSHPPLGPDLLRAAYEDAPIGVFVADGLGRITWCNRALCAMIGRSCDEVAGQPMAALVHPEDRLTDHVQSAGILSGARRSHQGRKRLARASGEAVHVMHCVHRVELEGRPHLVGHVVDLTDQVERDTEAQTHERMRTVGLLASTIAHDFGNLLTAIHTNAELLADAVEDPEIRDMAEDILSAAESGARLTARLLTFGQSGGSPDERIDLAALARARLPALRAAAPGCAVEVDADEPAWILGDPQALEQVLLNLVSNARGASEVRVQVRRLWSEVHLDVRDDGPGMSEGVRRRAFEPYFTTRGADGSGLGLTTVYGIVTRHSGSVSIASTPGAGTTVSIRLPGAEPPTGEGVATTGPIDPRGRAVVLVVDDHGPTRRAVSRALRHSGCRALEAPDLATARARVARHGKRLTAVITEVVLPDGSGVDLATEVGATHPDVKVLFVSGYPRQQLATYAQHDLEPFLAKPFSTEELVAAVGAMLS